ncbi:MAG: helix-hairpin-helix domain-containing protein [Eubacteriales bacterium]|nr:helix-hairpin-helix domain-containing protein [Eubacteriales bacterium]
MKKRKNILFCFYFLAVTIIMISGCEKEEKISLSEISEQTSDPDALGSEKSDSSKEKSVYEISSEDEQDTGQDEQKSPDSKMVCVYVCGRVNHPDVYKLEEGSRICDAVQAAGGMLEDGAMDYINQAQLLEDGERIYIPSIEEAKTMTGQPGDSLNNGVIGTEAESSGKVNINSAGKELLMTLSGIGASKAEAIIRYRETNGGFDSVEELMQVEGIKEGTFEKIKNNITL